VPGSCRNRASPGAIRCHGLGPGGSCPGSRPSTPPEPCTWWCEDRKGDHRPRSRVPGREDLRRDGPGKRTRLAQKALPGNSDWRGRWQGAPSYLLGHPRLPGCRLRRRLPVRSPFPTDGATGRRPGRRFPPHTGYGGRHMVGRGGAAPPGAHSPEPGDDHRPRVRGAQPHRSSSTGPPPGPCGGARGRPQEGCGYHAEAALPLGPGGHLRVAPGERGTHPTPVHRAYGSLGGLQPRRPPRASGHGDRRNGARCGGRVA
jgi:hypothetical protein